MTDRRRRVRKNLAPSSALLDVRSADERALLEERRRRVLSWRAESVGLVAEDHKHLLVAGTRTLNAIVNGTAFYDPVADEGVLVAPQDRGVMISVGPLHLREAAGLSQTQRGCLDLVSSAYNDDRDVVSRWAVRSVLEAAAEVLSRDGIPTPSWRDLVAPDPVGVWRMLGDLWIMQPWGIGVSARLAAWT